jgi:hypothetical protein
MHAVPPAIWIVVIPAGVTVLLGPHNPPCSWTGIVGPYLASLLPVVWIPCYAIGLIRRPMSILQDSPEVTYTHFAHLHISSLALT